MQSLHESSTAKAKSPAKVVEAIGLCGGAAGWARRRRPKTARKRQMGTTAVASEQRDAAEGGN